MRIKDIKIIVQKIIYIVILLQVALIYVFPTISSAEDNNVVNNETSSVTVETTLGTINIKYPNKTLNIDDEISIQIYVEEASLLSLYSQIKYDKDIFEIENFENSVEPMQGWSVTEGKETEVRRLMLYAGDEDEAASNVLLATIKFKVKAIKGDTSEFYFNNIVVSDTNYEDSLDENGLGIDKKITFKFNNIKEKLYLSSEVYKIGDNDIDNYEDGDIYLEKITPETTVAEFIKNCKTNGTMKVLNSKGEELKETDLVGTNMTIKVTGHDEEFILTSVVMGDLDGNGLVTVTDLSGVNQAVLKTIELKDAIFKAADLDDNNQITVTDLSGINQTILKTIKLTYDKKTIKK